MKTSKCKKCKTKGCPNILPEGYKYNKCEKCRNLQAENMKKYGKAALGFLSAAAVAVVSRVVLKKPPIGKK